MATERASKMQKVTSTCRIRMLSDFHLQDCRMEPIVKSSKCNLIPLGYTNGEKITPVLVQLGGGGLIPRSFGIEDKEIDGRRKVQLACQIDSIEDHEHLDRLRTELGEVAVTKWAGWFPAHPVPSREVLMNFGGNFVSARKKRSNSESMWSGVCKSTIEPEECLSGRCKIVDSVTGDCIPFASLPGMSWDKMILEFRYVFIQATKSYGISKKLRYLSCTPAEDDDEIEPL
jgi:hypothetical protein